MKIAINSYSLRNEFQANHNNEPLIKLCNELDIKEVELLDRDVDIENIQKQKKLYEDNGITIFSLAPHVKLLTTQNKVQDMINEGEKWLKLAHSIGAKMIRVQLSNGPFPQAFPPMDDFDDEEWEEYNEQMLDAAEFTKKVADPLIKIAEELDVAIGIETHHSYSSNYIYQSELNKLYPSKYLGWVFDIGNYENDSMRWKALDVIKNKTLYVHAKAYKFDENGMETKLDYPKAYKILQESGFDGIWSIEFEGKYNGILGVLQTNEIINYSVQKYLGAVYPIKTDFLSEEELFKKYS